jgi:hypothetical protein
MHRTRLLRTAEGKQGNATVLGCSNLPHLHNLCRLKRGGRGGSYKGEGEVIGVIRTTRVYWFASRVDRIVG